MMNINSIPAENMVKPISNTKIQPQMLFLNKPMCDMVSFSGHKQPVSKNDLTERQQAAIQIAKKLTKLAHSNELTKENIESLLNQNSPVPVDVCDIKEAPAFIQQAMGGKVIAHMMPQYESSNLQLAKATIYINMDGRKTAKETNGLIANIAHEYTHVLQRAEDKTYYSMTNYTNDADKITQMAREAQSVMQNHLGNCGRIMFSNPQRTRAILNSRLNNPNSLKPLIPNLNLKGAISDRANLLSQYVGQEIPVGACMTQFILQESQNEVEAYKVTEEIMKNSGKYDESDLAKCLLSYDLHANIVDLMK